jgi:hypothetical protein
MRPQLVVPTTHSSGSRSIAALPKGKSGKTPRAERAVDAFDPRQSSRYLPIEPSLPDAMTLAEVVKAL